MQAGPFPRPLTAAAPLLAAALLAGAIDAAPVPWVLGGAIALALVAAGVVRAARAALERARLRHAADELLLAGRSPTSSALVARRAAELTALRRRRSLSRTLDGLLRELDGRTLAGASPVNRVAARRNRDQLQKLADRLAAVDRPVCARGVLAVEQLLTDGAGPLYDRGRAARLPAAIHDAVRALDGR